jgi:hypothetical protein
MRRYVATLFCIYVACFAAVAARASPIPKSAPPPSFVVDALCVHSGWHYATHGEGSPDYVLWGHGYWHTYQVGNGEGGWTATSAPGYGGGLSFEEGTFNRAAGLSHGVVPYVGSTYQIATLSPVIQLYAMWMIVQQDGGSYREWPMTSRACGL